MIETKNILFLSEKLTQGSDNATITVEAKYPKFLQNQHINLYYDCITTEAIVSYLLMQ